MNTPLDIPCPYDGLKGTLYEHYVLSERVKELGNKLAIKTISDDGRLRQEIMDRVVAQLIEVSPEGELKLRDLPAEIVSSVMTSLGCSRDMVRAAFNKKYADDLDALMPAIEAAQIVPRIGSQRLSPEGQ
jgi:hypothetical protein